MEFLIMRMGERICRRCKKRFEKQGRRDKVCMPCKAEVRQENIRNLNLKRLMAGEKR